MKTNPKITIWLMSVILIFWISFLFIEQNKTNISETEQTTTESPYTHSNKETKQQEDIKQKKVEISEIKVEEKEAEETQTTTTKKPSSSIFKNLITNNKQEEEKTITEPIIIPKEYDIQNMDFFSQAPYGNWNQPYQDACEEASLLIWYYYLKNITKTKAEYNTDLLAMVDLEMQMLWYFESTTIMEMKQIINRRDKTIHASIIEHPTIRDIEREISQNHIVVAPLYGKWLKNPHYALWWPEYHFLVIKWYNQTNFITHDVWTLRWANREYTKSIIMENIHDRNRTDVRMWAARILILE